VAARSPRLARCFEGTERPGALRWTASYDPHTGAVADHRFEPVLAGAMLLAAQRECLVGTLASPGYRPTEQAGSSGPLRVSMVLEF